jgi:hypothetical protein
MKVTIPLLMFACCATPVLEAASSAAIQQLTRVNTVPPAVTARIVQTQGQVLKLQDMVLKVNEQAKTDPAAEQQAKEAQQKLEEAQKAAEAAGHTVAGSTQVRPSRPAPAPHEAGQRVLSGGETGGEKCVSVGSRPHRFHLCAGAARFDLFDSEQEQSGRNW